MRKNVKDKLVGIYAPGHYEHISVLERRHKSFQDGSGITTKTWNLSALS